MAFGRPPTLYRASNSTKLVMGHGMTYGGILSAPCGNCSPRQPLPSTMRNAEQENAFLTLFSGLTSVADWLGSMEEYFPYAEAPIDLPQYCEQAAKQAEQALHELNWTGWRPPDFPWQFQQLFTFSPSPMQDEVIRLATKLNKPAVSHYRSPDRFRENRSGIVLGRLLGAHPPAAWALCGNADYGDQQSDVWPRHRGTAATLSRPSYATASGAQPGALDTRGASTRTGSYGRTTG